MIEASLRVPIFLEWNLTWFEHIDHIPHLDALLEKVRQRRFILYVRQCQNFGGVPQLP